MNRRIVPFAVIEIICAILLFDSVLSQSVQWKKLNGPPGGQIQSIAFDSSGRIYAGGSNGYVSTDDGKTWVRLMLVDNVNLAVVSLAVDSGDIMLAGTDGWGIYRSTDHGNNWARSDSGMTSFNSYFWTTSLCVANKRLIYAATHGRLFHTSNHGITWVVDSSVGNGGYKIASLNDTTLLVGTLSGKLYRSTNGGQSWSLIKNWGYTNQGIFDIAKNADGHIVCAVADSGVYRSSDNGSSWTRILDAKIGVGFFSVVYGKDGSIYAGNSEGRVFYSKSNGATWHDTLLSSGIVNVLIAGPEGRIYVGTDRDGMFSTADGATTWKTNGPDASWISEISVAQNGTLFAGVRSQGLFRSTDHGTTWMKSNSNLNLGTSSEYCSALVDLPGGDLLMGVAGGDLYRSSDNGQRWISVGLEKGGVWSIGCNPTTKDLFVGHFVDVSHSSDDGKTWNSAQLPGALAWSEGVRTFVFDEAGNVFAGHGYGGVYKSSDRGSTWIPVNSGLESTVILAMTQTAEGDILCSTLDSKTYRMAKGGAIWTLSNNGLQDAIVSDLKVNSQGLVFAASNHGIFTSSNGGREWTPTNSGLPSVQFTDLYIDGEGYVWAGTMGHGIFVTSQATTTVGNVSFTNPSLFTISQNFPNPFNPTTTISYQQPTVCHVKLSIFDLLGREVAVLVDEENPAGTYEVTWDAEGFSSGIYFYTLSAGEFRATKKLVLMR